MSYDSKIRPGGWWFDGNECPRINFNVDISGEENNKTPIEDAFSQTTRILFGDKLEQIDDYAEWLASGSKIRLDKERSCWSSTQVLVSDYASFLNYPRNKLLTQEEADAFGEVATAATDNLTLANAPEKLSAIAYFSPFWLAGKLKNNINSPLNVDSVDCYGGVLYLRSKLCAFCFSPRSCDYSFGSREGRHLSFTINCHFSTRLTRCFEMDSSNDCSDCYFCHNCENVQESMFCFNTRNKRYAVGNVEIGKDKYLEMKKALQKWLLEKLKNDKKIEANVFKL